MLYILQHHQSPDKGINCNIIIVITFGHSYITKMGRLSTYLFFFYINRRTGRELPMFCTPTGPPLFIA